MLMLFVVLTLLVFSVLYKRHCPVLGVESIQHVEEAPSQKVLLDVRDYQTAVKQPIGEAIQIPVGYLKRNYNRIENKPIHVIASTPLDKNLSIRYLRQKNFRIDSYTIVKEH